MDALQERLMAVLTAFIQKQLYPTPYGLRMVGEALLELREIMLTCNDALLEAAIQEMEFWIRNTELGNSYDLHTVLRDLRASVCS
jgi:hypothetical protein